MSKIEVTTKQLFGYTLIIAGIILFIYVAANAILLVNGTIQPIKVEMPNPVSGYDVFAGILLQVGLFWVLVGIGFCIARVGLSLIKDET